MKVLTHTILTTCLLFSISSCDFKDNRPNEDMENPMEVEPGVSEDEIPVISLDEADTITFKIDESASTLNNEINNVESDLDYLLEDEN